MLLIHYQIVDACVGLFGGCLGGDYKLLVVL